MVNEEIVGTDINYNWILNSGKDKINGYDAREGDITLAKGSDNLSQAIYLRLTAYLNSLAWAYTDYGSTTKDWLGKNQNPYTQQTLIDEIHRRVIKDPRIKDAEVELINWTVHSLGIKINAHVQSGKTFQEYFIFSDLPRKNENINSPEYTNTFIDTKQDGYYGKVGQLLTVKCYVRDKKGQKVPIGEVSLNIGTYHVDIEENPQEIAQSGSSDPGSCVFTFRIPRFITNGVHKLIFRYKGMRGYNNCVGETNLYVVDRLPTTMEYVYPKQGYDYYYANDWDVWTEPVVHVMDANDWDVLHGEVRYYMDDYQNEDDYILIEFPIIFHVNKLITYHSYLYVKSKILDYSEKFIFKVNYMFRPGDQFRLVSKEGEHIDTLECQWNAEKKSFLLYSTDITKPYKNKDKTSKREDTDRNDDIDVQRKGNSHILMEVLE